MSARVIDGTTVARTHCKCSSPFPIARLFMDTSVLASKPCARRSSTTSSHRHELGGACCVYLPRREGRRPLGRYSQQADRASRGNGTRWSIVYSATKGLAAMTLALAHSRGWLDYEERVCRYWPEFAQQGKEHDHRSPAARAPGRAVRARRAGRSRPRRRPRPPGRRAGAPEAGVGAGHAAGLSRHHARVSTKASCCGASIRSIAVWAGSSRTRSRRRSGSTSTSGCRNRFRTRGWRRSRGRDSGRDAARLSGPRFMLEAMNPRSNISRALRDPSCRSIPSRTSMRATSRCRPAAPSAPRARSRMPTACSPLAGANSGCGRRRWTCWPRRRFLRRTGFYDECLKGGGAVLAGLHEAESRCGRSAAPRSFGSPGAGGSHGLRRSGRPASATRTSRARWGRPSRAIRATWRSGTRCTRLFAARHGVRGHETLLPEQERRARGQHHAEECTARDAPETSTPNEERDDQLQHRVGQHPDRDCERGCLE